MPPHFSLQFQKYPGRVGKVDRSASTYRQEYSYPLEYKHVSTAGLSELSGNVTASFQQHRTVLFGLTSLVSRRFGIVHTLVLNTVQLSCKTVLYMKRPYEIRVNN